MNNIRGLKSKTMSLDKFIATCDKKNDYFLGHGTKSAESFEIAEKIMKSGFFSREGKLHKNPQKSYLLIMTRQAKNCVTGIGTTALQ